MRLAPGGLVVAAALVGACVPRTSEAPPPAQVPPPRSYPVTGLQMVIGSTASALIAQFGRPDLDLREGSARKLQFLGPACVLDVYLYPPRGGGEPVATHIDARLPDGREMDRASCIAALNARRQER